MANNKKTIPQLQSMKQAGKRLTMVTAYDYPSALLAEKAELDILLVGDSLAMTVLGRDSTVSATVEEMLHHCRAVARGATMPLLVGDMPFLSYQVSQTEAVRNAGRFLKEGAMESVKLEGGRSVAPTVEAIVAAGIPVMGHIGLTPQTVSKLGGYRVQGRTARAAIGLIDDALALQAAGCYALVLEAIPTPVAQAITNRVKIPTIGIGAGPHCDGQVLVYHDLLGMFERFTPSFVKTYAQLSEIILEALIAYREDVSQGRFPDLDHAYALDEEALDEFRNLLASHDDLQPE
jgi:3-methyl-2-oxobutanoate hydroxymethyltransferase